MISNMYHTIKKLYIEPTSRCNLNCVMCFRNSWINEGLGDLEMPTFYKIIEDSEALKDTETVCFGGMGEPLVHPDIYEMIAFCKEKSFRTELITNGTMLTSENSQQLIEAGLDKLWVSVDSFEEGQYEEIQVGSRFSLITEQIEEFNRLRKGTSIALGIGIVLMKSNLPQLSRMESYCQKVKADDVNLSHMIPNTPDAIDETLWQLTEKAEATERTNSWGYDVLESMVSGKATPDTERKDASNPGTVARFRFLHEDLQRIYGYNPSPDMLNDRMEVIWQGKIPERTENRSRFVAEGNCFIRWDGDDSPCMGLLHSAATYIQRYRRTVWHHSFGNMREQTLSEIWNNADYSNFRQRVMDFDFSPCTSCGGCELRNENKEDCFGNTEPTCGACLWGQGFIQCP